MLNWKIFVFLPLKLMWPAVDFQYVGGGVGVKDLAYFISSCLYDDESEKYEVELLNYYFNCLKLSVNSLEIDFVEMEKEWRELFYFAWADFHRFYKGWTKGYWSSSCYSEKVTKSVIAKL